MGRRRARFAPRPKSRGVNSSRVSRIPNPAVTWSREGAGFTEFLQAEQSLPVFGVRASLARAGVAATAAAEADRDVRLWVLRSEASAAVARLAAEQERVAAADALVREIERLIEILRTREQEGEGSRFDRLRAEQELRDTRQQATAAAAAAAEARATLSGMLPAGVVHRRVSTAGSPRSARISRRRISRRRCRPRDDSARAELRALQQAAQRATAEAEAARRARLPAPTVFGGLKRADVERTRA